MPPFPGFPSGKVRHTPIPATFFSELLPQIDHLAELKLTLYLFWRIHRMEGTFRFLRREDIAQDAIFMQGLGATTTEQNNALDEALERALLRGTLLAAHPTQPGRGNGTLYFLNTPRGRAAVQGLAEGKWQPEDLPNLPVELAHERPNIFQLYEANLGPLTPLIADTLRDAEATYPAEWIEEAFQIAVANNVRKWRYIEAILESWQQQGRDDQKDRSAAGTDYRKYIQGKFSDYIEH